MAELWKTVCALLLSGGVFFFGGCFHDETKIARGVTVNGVGVGGMTRAEATELIRARIAETLPPLTIRAPSGETTVRYPELSFTDDVPELLATARAGEALTAHVTRTWAETERFAEELCAANAREAVNAKLTVKRNGFEYTPEIPGIACDYKSLTEEIERALSDGETVAELPVREYAPAVTEKSLRARTRKLSSFTTYFDANNLPRSENIRLSASRISGTELAPGEEFSFNAAVGLRTTENGFQIATIISNGQFTEGVGGGVCQTSTTLFNAALLAGMKITESRNHSLAIGYVKPSLDAMVSRHSDLKFVNASDFPVYIFAETKDGAVTFRFCGAPNGRTYETESVTIMKMEPPPAQIVEGEEEKVLRKEKEGLVSESYLLTYENGKLLSRVRIRRDSYAAVQGIVQKPAARKENAASESLVG